MKLSEKIYYCRKKAGLSQDALAEKLDVSRQAISKWENGEAVPETGKLPGLAKMFGVYPSSSITANTFSFVFSLTFWFPFKTRETVAIETPAFFETS